VLARAGLRGAKIPELEGARLAVLAARWEGDRVAQRRAWQALVRAAPAEAESFRHLGETELALCRYAEAAKALQQAAARDPFDAWLLNQLGYARSYARDLARAVASLQRYRELRPDEANPLDSLGDVHYYLGHFGEAEKYYLAAWSKDPGFLGGGEPYKAAWARLMQGNRRGADELFEKYIEARRGGGDPSVDLRRAQWEYLAGRQQEAVVRLEGQATVAAWVQLAVWKLSQGDRAGARERAARAGRAARDPASALMARLSQYLAGPEGTAEEWAARAQRAFPEAAQAPLRRSALAYALLLTRQFAAALPLVREIHESTPASANEPANVLLAWALVEAGRAGEVGDLLNTYPAPQPGGEQVFACLSFPRILQLRGVVQGRRARAAGSS
jgi:tetratricopeptide (TPR) repeat protein